MAVNSAFYPTNQSVITMNAFNIKSPSCTVNTPIVNVTMGNVVKNQFNGIGTPLNDLKNINISLNCPANTAVSIQVDGSVLDATKGLLNLQPSSSNATGVAIQILYNNLPFELATPIPVGTALADGIFTIPLQARYYQSGATITPGRAVGTATFTLTYK